MHLVLILIFHTSNDAAHPSLSSSNEKIPLSIHRTKMTHKYVYVSFIGYISYIHTDHKIPQGYKIDDAAVIIGDQANHERIHSKRVKALKA